MKHKNDSSTKQLFVEFSRTNDPKIRRDLILRHTYLVKKIALKFIHKGKSLESLISVGNLALINALNRYDIKRGVKFSTYATSCIIGEIKKYFRDYGWGIKVPRGLKNSYRKVQSTIEDLTKISGYSPTISEISDKLNISEEEVIEAIEVRYAYNPISLDTNFTSEETNGDSLKDCLPDKESFQELDEKLYLKDAIKKLSKKEQMIIHLYYFEGLSQSGVSRRIGFSQMHISRLLKGAKKKLKEYLVSTG